MTSATVEFDFDDVVRTVERFDSRANRDDAEEAVQGAVERMLGRDEPLIPSYVVMKARSVLANAVRRSERRNSSLDAFLESDEDSAPVELAVDEVDFDTHAELAAVSDRPLIAEKRRNLEAGSDVRIAPRGTFNHRSRYSDCQVEAVKRLRATGMKFAAIEAQTGVERSMAAKICRGEVRVAGSSEGWTDEKAVAAIADFARREGRPPRYVEGQKRADLPNPATFSERGRTWRELCADAGCPSPYADRTIRTARWTIDEAREVLLAKIKGGRRPLREEDLRAPCPSSQTCRRLFGTYNLRAIETAVLSG